MSECKRPTSPSSDGKTEDDWNGLTIRQIIDRQSQSFRIPLQSDTSDIQSLESIEEEAKLISLSADPDEDDVDKYGICYPEGRVERHDVNYEAHSFSAHAAVPYGFDQHAELESAVFNNEYREGDVFTAYECNQYFYFHVSFKNCVYGTFRNQHACRIVLDFSFQQLAAARFKRAVIELSFEDAGDAHEEFNRRKKGDTAYQPRILEWDPRHYKGPMDLASGTRKHKTFMSIPLGASLTKSLIGVTKKKEQPTVAEGSFRMHGVRHGDPPSQLTWVLHENKMRKNGVLPEVSIAMIVSCTPGRAFALRTSMRTDVARRQVYSSTRLNGKPATPHLFLPPDLPAEGSPYGIGRLDDESLRDLTRLT